MMYKPEFDSNKNFVSNHPPNDPYNENNFSSNNSRIFKNSEFNSVQNDFNYNIQMGFTSKISTLIKNVKSPKNTEDIDFLLSRTQAFEKYEDEDFKPDFPYEIDPNLKISWVSPKEFLNEDICLFPKDANGFFMPTNFNNNAFISAMNLLLSNPNLMSRLFESDQVNSPGIYGVWLCENGAWKLMIIDDQVPSLNSQYALNAFAGKENCIFHMILQKALAKLYKSYQNLRKTPIHAILNDLTGSHVDVKNLMDLQTNEDVWALIKKWKEANYMVFLQKNIEGEKDEGLAFSLVECIEIVPTQEYVGLAKILRLKTPLKGKTFQGKYNKNAGLSSEEKKRLKFDNTSLDDVFFCLTLEECLKFFTEIGVCKAQNKINSMYCWTVVKNHESFLVKFHLESPGTTVISLNQKQGPHHIRVMMAKEELLSKEIEDNLKFIAADYSNKKIFIEKNGLESGNYLLIVEISWAEGFENEVTIGCLCENEPMNQEMSFEIFPKKNAEVLKLQKGLLKNYAKSKESDTMRIRDYSSSGEPSIIIYNDMIFGLSYFYYINQSNKKLKEIISMQTLKNLKICEPFKDSMSFEIELDPQQDQMVVYKYDKNGKDFSYALIIKASLERANSVISSSQINYENSEIMMNASKIKSASVSLVFSEQNPKDELFKLIKQKGEMNKRIWNSQEIEILVYTCVHKEGIAMLYCNNTKQKFNEIIHLVEMTNLEYCNKELKEKTQKIVVFLEPGKTEMILFNKLSKEEFTFRFKHIYKVF